MHEMCFQNHSCHTCSSNGKTNYTTNTYFCFVAARDNRRREKKRHAEIIIFNNSNSMQDKNAHIQTYLHDRMDPLHYIRLILNHYHCFYIFCPMVEIMRLQYVMNKQYKNAYTILKLLDKRFPNKCAQNCMMYAHSIDVTTFCRLNI